MVPSGWKKKGDERSDQVDERDHLGDECKTGGTGNRVEL
jgi:hypothetical protein